MNPRQWGDTANTVFAVVLLKPSTFMEICETLNAHGFAAQKTIRNALQLLRKDGAIEWDRKWSVKREVRFDD
jgi:hypothetical protein